MSTHHNNYNREIKSKQWKYFEYLIGMRFRQKLKKQKLQENAKNTEYRRNYKY